MPQSSGSPEQTLRADNAFQELTIEKLVYGGDGLGRLSSGEVVFIPWSAPGDCLEVEIAPGNKKPKRGNITRLLEPATERVNPACSVFGVCGGCQWQHIKPSAQRDWKRAIVVENLRRLGKLENLKVLETLGTDDTAWRYRNRVQWELRQNPDQSVTIGYHQTQSPSIVGFETCHIMPESLNLLADWLKTFWESHPELASDLQRVEVLMNSESQMILTFSGLGQPCWEGFVEALKTNFPNVMGILYKASLPEDLHAVFAEPIVIDGQSYLTMRLGSHAYQVSSGSFFQVNTTAAEAMLSVLEDWLSPEVNSLLDLYAGVGLFSIFFQKKASRILAVESNPSAVADAQVNFQAFNAPHIEMRTGEVGKILQALSDENPDIAFDAAIIDPPRTGCRPEVLAWLSAHVRRQLLYVSCDPSTLARDLKTLTQAGWRVDAVQPVDMFPQTYHIETLVNLVR